MGLQLFVSRPQESILIAESHLHGVRATHRDVLWIIEGEAKRQTALTEAAVTSPEERPVQLAAAITRTSRPRTAAHAVDRTNLMADANAADHLDRKHAHDVGEPWQGAGDMQG